MYAFSAAKSILSQVNHDFDRQTVINRVFYRKNLVNQSTFSSGRRLIVTWAMGGRLVLSQTHGMVSHNPTIVDY